MELFHSHQLITILVVILQNCSGVKVDDANETETSSNEDIAESTTKLLTTTPDDAEQYCNYIDLIGKNHKLRFYPNVNLGQSFVDYVERGHDCKRKVTCQSDYNLKIEECTDVEKIYNVTCENIEDFQFPKTGGFPRCCLKCETKNSEEQ